MGPLTEYLIAKQTEHEEKTWKKNPTNELKRIKLYKMYLCVCVFSFSVTMIPPT